MLKSGQKHNQERLDIESLIGTENLKVVELVKNETPYGTNLKLTLYNKDHEITTDELADVYRILYPRYSLLLNDRDLTLEVSSPGLQRNFKDIYEFEVFAGKCVRVYSDVYSSWIIGDIISSDEKELILKNVLIEDTKETHELLTISLNSIQKAKLEFRWEEK